MSAPGALPFVAILRGVTPDEVLAHARGLVEARFAAVEVPTGSPAWAESVRRLAAEHRDGPEVGAGTVLRLEDVDALAAAGGRLMVTPNTDASIVRAAKAKGLRALVGAMTPTEVLAAVAAGADAVKIFPASVVGPGFARIVGAVLPREVPLYAVGGIRPDNLRDFAGKGWAGYGLGGELYRPGQTPAETEAKAAAFRRAWEALPA
ncbi:MAG TPA: 2-dehydro-3-deoxy-6-phosphogalactonate aldolase [Polyangia bacterium]|nr:2-dehydro-3-deoxy-6-phosphogalactonate aldolase [Polyangia bacterium]